MSAREYVSTKRGSLVVLIVLGAMGAVPALSTDFYLPGFPAIANDLSVSLEQMQLTLAASFFGLGVGQLIYGPISDRYGRRIPAMIGLALFVLGSFICTLAQSFEILMLARLFQGLGGAAAVVISRAIVRDLYEGKEMARKMSAIQSIITISPTIAPTIGALILIYADWRWIFALLAVLGLIIWIAIWRLPESLAPANRNQHNLSAALRSYGQLLKDPEYRTNTLQVFFNSLLLFAYVVSAPAIYMGQFKLSGSALGVIFGATAVALFLGSQFNRTLLMKFSIEGILNTAIWIQVGLVATLMAVTLFAPNLYAVIFLQMATIAVCAPISTNGMTLALKHYSHKAAAASAVIGTLQHGSAAVMGTILTAVAAAPLLRMSGGMMAASICAIAIMLVRGMQIKKQEARA